MGARVLGVLAVGAVVFVTEVDPGVAVPATEATALAVDVAAVAGRSEGDAPDDCGVLDTAGEAALVGVVPAGLVDGAATAVGDDLVCSGALVLAAGAVCVVGADVWSTAGVAADWLVVGREAVGWVAVGVVLLAGWLPELTLMMVPSVLVTGSVTAWRTPETADVSPESGPGWVSVAA